MTRTVLEIIKHPSDLTVGKIKKKLREQDTEEAMKNSGTV